MFVRIARFEGGDPERIQESVDSVKAEIGGGQPPPGLEGAKEVWMLVDRENGRGLGLTVFESEEELRRGDEALNQMSPSQPGLRRSSVEMYEVALRHTLG